MTFNVQASHYNVRAGVDNLLQALDGRPDTRWSSRRSQQPGMWFEIELSDIRLVSGLALDTAGSPRDYPRGYIVSVSTDRSRWVEVARREQNDRALDIAFAAQPARYLRIEQTGSDPVYWWSIHGVNVTAGPATFGLSASHNNTFSGADNLGQVLDDQPETRWSTRAVQRSGMWFEIELSAVRPVRGLALDTTGSPNDYPRGYAVSLSTDRSRWIEVARNDDNDSPVDISFAAQPARYLRIEQTGSALRWWWSIHGVVVK